MTPPVRGFLLHITTSFPVKNSAYSLPPHCLAISRPILAGILSSLNKIQPDFTDGSLSAGLVTPSPPRRRTCA